MSFSLRSVLCSALLLAGLIGCGVTSSNVLPAGPSVGAALSGTAHGGQQPIVGALVQLMAAGQTGYGSAPATLATTTSGVGGNFHLPSYSCPANAGLTYLVVTGGDAGSGVNPLIGEAAVLGPCSSLTAATFVTVSEATTVAAAYVLAPFASVSTLGTSIGSSATNLGGLKNTFAVSQLLVPYSHGYANAATAVSGVILPTLQVNTLANILASCVNSTGSLVTGSSCAVLFTGTTINSVAPIDTFQAALNMALAPGANVSGLYGLASANPPFQPALSSAPPDFAVAIGYNGSTINANGTAALAIDASGNAWVAGAPVVAQYGGTTTQTGDLIQITPAGAVTNIAPGTACGVGGVAIESTGTLAITCLTEKSVRRYTPAGTLVNTYTSASSLAYPEVIAIDGSGNLWVENGSSGGLGALSSAGVPLGGSPFMAGLSYNYGSIGIDPQAITSSYFGFFHVDTATHTAQVYGVNSSFFLNGTAVDASGNIWSPANSTSVTGTNALFEVSNGGTLLSPSSGYPATSNTVQQQSIAIDGLGRVYTAGYRQHNGNDSSGAVQVFSASGALLGVFSGGTNNTAINTFLSPVPANPWYTGLAIDGSGNLWVAGNYGTFATPYRTVAMLVGFAAPVTTPAAAAVIAGKVGMRP